MRGIVIYDSSYGNTKTVAETISEILTESGLDVSASYVKKVKKPENGKYDFMVVGSPTRFGTMSFTMKGFLGKLQEEHWAKKPFAAFDTELPQNIVNGEGSAAEKIAEKLEEKQMNRVLPVLKTAVTGNKGPLEEYEMERIKEFSLKLAYKLTR